MTVAEPRIRPAVVDPAFEAEVHNLGRQLARRRRSIGQTKRGVDDRAMTAMSANPHLRAAFFRLVDVAPACRGERELSEHLAAYLEEAEGAGLPATALARTADSRALGGVGGWVAARVVRQMANRFIVGESVADAAPALGRIWRQGAGVTVDLLGEATVTQAEGQAYADRCEEALLALDAASRAWPVRPLLEADSVGPIPRVNLSVKITALTPLVRAEAPGRGIEDVAPRLRTLLRRAKRLGAHLHLDMESMDSRELALEVLFDLLADPEFASGPSTGLVLQAYLRDSEDLLEWILQRAAAPDRDVPLTIRLVKGAYWDHETIEAHQNGWESPVWAHKAESDRCFERLSRRLLDSYPLVRTAIASHNLRSIAHAAAYADRIGLAPSDYEVQVLRGLGDDLQESVPAVGLRCRAYCPVGDLVAGMSYLVRRLLENTSNASFLATRASGSDLEELLGRP